MAGASLRHVSGKCRNFELAWVGQTDSRRRTESKNNATSKQVLHIVPRSTSEHSHCRCTFSVVSRMLSDPNSCTSEVLSDLLSFLLESALVVAVKAKALCWRHL